jgi:L-fucose mutarotase
MLFGTLIHPQILDALGRAGHGSKILLADGNYPAGTALGPRSRLVHLNLAPGCLTVSQVLDVLLTAVPVEAAAVMDHEEPSMGEPAAWAEFSRALGRVGVDELERIKRREFYEVAGRPDVALTVATGDQRTYSNLLLTVGVVAPGR